MEDGSDEKMRRFWIGLEVVVAGLPPFIAVNVQCVLSIILNVAQLMFLLQLVMYNLSQLLHIVLTLVLIL